MSKKGLVGRYISKRIFYVGEKTYQIKRDLSIQEVDQGHIKKGAAIILGKKFYFETSKQFPFSNIRDLRSAIAIDTLNYSPFKTERFLIRKIGKKNGETLFNIWFIEEEIYKDLLRLSPLIIIPETALLSFLGKGGGAIYKINREHEDLLVYIGGNGIIKSVSGGNGKNDVKNFKRSIGYEAKDLPEIDIARPEEYFGLFQRLISHITLKRFFYFANPNLFSVRLNKKYIKIGLTSIGIIFLLYGASVGIYVSHAKNELRMEDDRLSLNLSGLLKKQERTDYYHKISKELASNINAYTYKLPILNMLNDILPERAVIRHVSISGSIIQIKGTSTKGSDLLSILSKTRGIKGAGFISPVREDRKTGLENFEIRFNYEKD